MRIKGIPGHERCTDNGCEAGVMEFSCLSTDKVYTAASGELPDVTYSMALPTALVYEDGNLYSGKYVPSVSIKVDEKHASEHEDGLGIDLIKEAQKRILEKAIERLETVKATGYDKPREIGICCNNCYEQVVDDALAELKSLIGEAI
jgi:hypothetical protein